ncbi:MAG: hypothetical protein KC897_01675 [Candidatus Omnitrophica bacterium]|nr:hypothetical protein [Candidatus Omnitrophota bacterium]MCB9721972.1 hypothetical protein [Candidatus Omnitrophota bacterium]
MRKLLAVFLITLMTAGIASARTDIIEDEVQKANKIKTKRYFWTTTLDDLNVVGKVKHIPENNKVIVPYFRVTFATGGKYLNAVGGVTTSKTKVKSRLTGVDEATMQKITDAMYADLLDRLREQGYEVVDVGILDANPDYQSLQEKSKYPIIKKDHAQFTPGGRFFPGAVAVKALMLARDVDAVMLKADYTVNFVTMSRNEKKFNILKDKSDVSVGQGINVFGEIAAITEKGPVIFQIQQPIGSEIPLGSVADATTAMDKVSDGVALVGSVLGGKIGNRTSTTSVEVEADPDAYRNAAEDALGKSNGTLVSFMTAQIRGEELSESDLQQ